MSIPLLLLFFPWCTKEFPQGKPPAAVALQLIIGWSTCHLDSSHPGATFVINITAGVIITTGGGERRRRQCFHFRCSAYLSPEGTPPGRDFHYMEAVGAISLSFEMERKKPLTLLLPVFLIKLWGIIIRKHPRFIQTFPTYCWKTKETSFFYIYDVDCGNNNGDNGTFNIDTQR